MSQLKRGALVKIKSNIHCDKFQKDIDSILSSSDSPEIMNNDQFNSITNGNMKKKASTVEKEFQILSSSNSDNGNYHKVFNNNNNNKQQKLTISIDNNYDHLLDEDDLVVNRSEDDEYTDDDTVVGDDVIEYESQSENDITLVETFSISGDEFSDSGTMDDYSTTQTDEDSLIYLSSDSDDDDYVSKPRVSSSSFSSWTNARTGRNNNLTPNKINSHKIQYNSEEFIERVIEVRDEKYYKRQTKYLSLDQRRILRKDLEMMFQYVGKDIVDGWESLFEDAVKSSKKKLTRDQVNRLKAYYNKLITEYDLTQKQVNDADSTASRASSAIIKFGLSLEDVVVQLYQLFNHKYKIRDFANSLLNSKTTLAKSDKLGMIARDNYAPSLNIFLYTRDQIVRKFFHKYPVFLKDMLFKSRKFNIISFIPSINHPSANCYFFPKRKAKYILKLTIADKRRKICLSSHAYKPIKSIMACYFLLESIDKDRMHDEECQSVIVQKYTKVLHDVIIRVFKNNKKVPLKTYRLYLKEFN